MPIIRIKTSLLLLSAALVTLSACSDDVETTETTDIVEVVIPPIESFADLKAATLSTMGAEGLQRIEYTANGWEACLGQPWKISDGWARWEITDYNRVIDYSNMTSYQTAQRRAGLNPERLGGCGAQPNATASNQASSVTEASNWSQKLQYWLTPQGFLELASTNNAGVLETKSGYQVSLSVTEADTRYNFVGFFDQGYLLQSIETWIDNSVFGDMLFEAKFSDYQDFDGVLFPASIVQQQGGYSTLELVVDSFVANTSASSEAPPREGGGRFGGAPPSGDAEPLTKLAEGIYVVNGGYQSVLVEFDEYSVVIDGLQSDGVSRQLIQHAKELFPGKPIGYVINTHLHFDHASGLRDFVAEGATIITHKSNEAFFGDALFNPRTLNTSGPSTLGLPVNIEGVDKEFVLDDGTQRIEIYKLGDGAHAGDMLIAYLPGIKTIVEADLLQPWINPVFAGEGIHPFLVYLADELDDLGLDYEQFVPVHRPSPAPTMTRADLMEAITE